MDYLISHDKRFAAVQLFRFIPYTYEAASSVYYLTGQDALDFTRCLETNKILIFSMTLYVMKVKQACEGEPYLLKTLM